MSYAIGSLVKARGREWVVLPDSTSDFLLLKPIGGTEDEVTGIYLPIEPVESARFDLPDSSKLGDYRSCRLLRDAVKLGFRSSAGPFRSFASIAVEPRPYQLVPLLMALKLEPMRLLIADDVGVGKTIEAGLVAKEILERGEENRLAVLCPPHLVEQWQRELADKFHIEAELVLSSTASRLERGCGIGQSLFEVYPHVVVSTDFIKSDRRRDDFLRTCPNLVIVDEAHTFAFGNKGRGGRHQRHQLLSGLARDPERHLILLTATPHSGKEENFRSLLGFLKKDFEDLPEDLSGKHNEKNRRHLAEHFIQRRRVNIRHYMDSETPFPEREDAEHTHKLSPEYKKLFERVLKYARGIVTDESGGRHHQRVRWWSALALLRSLASSPAAAAATLKSRAATADTETSEEADEIGRHTILDLDINDDSDIVDVIPGSDAGEFSGEQEKNRRRLLDMARQAESLYGDKDEKVKEISKIVNKMIKEGFKPILFCRFIPTAEYVAEYLRKSLPKKVDVTAITGTLPPAEREERVLQLSQSPQRVLVATDCLSEGINLQEHFDAVIHYDLSWNPTRHEQREGRVDRFGQPRDKIRVLTYYGIDNQIDGIVIDVLIRKHKQIRSSLGISVPVPVDTNTVIEAILEGLLLREERGAPVGDRFEQLTMFEDYFKPTKEDLYGKWDDVAAKEKLSRTIFAQHSIKVDEVAGELKAARNATGSGVEVESFVREALESYGASVSKKDPVEIDLAESPRSVKDSFGQEYQKFKARFDMPVKEGVKYLSRTHPFVENLASYVFNSAMDPLIESGAERCGVIRTGDVERRTTLILIRLRYHIITKLQNGESQLLAEDCCLTGFTGSPQNARWLDDTEAEKLLNSKPSANIAPEQARYFIDKVINDFESLMPHLEEIAKSRGKELLDAHRRIRSASKLRGVQYRVEPQLPPDILGIYVYLPEN
ncbi:MAG: DEAD/DEAH box helicase [Candidatus Eremiobacteraeota bacterium]|nr:DEAD/DEAH box helicase [Candidatus Eremiobacteraeota bacterium]